MALEGALAQMPADLEALQQREAAIAKINEGAIAIAPLLLRDDYTQVDELDRLKAVIARCNALGVDVRTKPFDFIKFQGVVRMYPNASCFEQIRRLLSIKLVVTERGGLLSPEVLSKITDINLLPTRLGWVAGYAETPDGRRTPQRAMLAFPVKYPAANNTTRPANLDDLSNWAMKLETKFHRRATKAHSGMGAIAPDNVDDFIDAEGVEVEGELEDPRRAFFAVCSDEGWSLQRDQDARHQFYQLATGEENLKGSTMTRDQWTAVLAYALEVQCGSKPLPEFITVEGKPPVDQVSGEVMDAVVEAEVVGTETPAEPEKRSTAEAATLAMIKLQCNQLGVLPEWIHVLTGPALGAAFPSIETLSAENAERLYKWLREQTKDTVAKHLSGVSE